MWSRPEARADRGQAERGPTRDRRRVPFCAAPARVRGRGGPTLRIAPRVFASVSEPLLPEIRSALERNWPATVHNWWGTSEGGPAGISCGHGGMHLSEDLLIIEPVTADGRPIAPGMRAAKVFLRRGPEFRRFYPGSAGWVEESLSKSPLKEPPGKGHMQRSLA